MTRPPPPPDDLDRLAGGSEPGLFSELLEFLRENRKWWLVPILLVIGLFSLLMALASTGAAPFIYTLF